MARPKSNMTPQKKKGQTVLYQTKRGVQGAISRKIFKEIKRLQLSTKLCIPKLPFSRLIREVLQEFSEYGLKIQSKALEALQESAELHLVHLFEDAQVCAYHAKRCTVRPVDMILTLFLRGEGQRR